MKFTSRKRGFTIVELIIVIAVIAVLAAVLIPVFSGLVQQGKDAEAKVVVNTLNKGLAMTTTKPATMQAALEAVETNVGINVAKLDETYAKTGNKILWDSEYNTFLFVTKDGEKVSAPNVDKFTDKEINLWAVAKTTDDLKDNYSHYWYGGDVASVEVSTGFDAGVASVNAITYKTGATQSVVIRTNSEKTELTINAKNSDVQHYDVAGNVKVLAVKGASYHEHGNVIGTVTVESGHVQIESGAEVASIIASKSTTENVAASVTATSGATVGTVVVNDATASVEVKSGATVAEVAPGKDVTIDASKVTGITPSTTVIDTEKASDFAGGLGTEASPYLIATLEQLRNINNLSASSPVFVKQTADIVIEGAKSDYHNAAGDYSVIYKFNGVYDGNGKSITNKVEVSGATTWHSFMYYVYGNSVIKNLDVYLGDTWFNLISVGSSSVSITFDNIAFYNQNNTIFDVPGNNYGLLISFTYSAKIYASNIKNYANINNNENASGLFIGAWFLTREVKFTNCNNYANWNGSCGFFNGNTAYVGQVNGNYDNLTVEDCHNYGTIVGSKVNLLGTAIDESNSKEVELKSTNNFNGMYKMDATSGLIRKDADGKIELTNVEGATRYVLTLYYQYGGKSHIDGSTINGGFALSTDYEQAGLTNYNAVKFIDSATAMEKTDLGLTGYKSGVKYHDDANNVDYYYVVSNGQAYYVFDNPLTIEGDAMVMNGNPRYTLMVYNDNQLIAYENVNGNQILSK